MRRVLVASLLTLFALAAPAAARLRPTVAPAVTLFCLL
jgi:hypothetical protein